LLASLLRLGIVANFSERVDCEMARFDSGYFNFAPARVAMPQRSMVRTRLLVGGLPMQLDAAIAEELLKFPAGYVSNELIRIAA